MSIGKFIKNIVLLFLTCKSIEIRDIVRKEIFVTMNYNLLGRENYCGTILIVCFETLREK